MARVTRQQHIDTLVTQWGVTREEAVARVGEPRTRRKQTAPEQSVKRQILAYLRQRHIPAWPINVQGVPLHDGTGRHRPAPATGISDIVGIYQGRFLAIECKSAKGVLRPAQEMFLRTVREAGGIALVARSVSDVEEGLK